MLKTFVCMTLVFAIAYSQDTTARKSIKCNLCIGSPTSDCANASKASMAVQECHTIVIPRHHHCRHHHHGNHHQDPEATTSVNDIINNSIESADRPEFDEDFEKQVEENSTNGTPWRRGKIVLEPTCTYTKLKASNISTSLVARGCGFMPADKDFCTVVQKLNKYLIECKSCDTDECN